MYETKRLQRRTRSAAILTGVTRTEREIVVNGTTLYIISEHGLFAPHRWLHVMALDGGKYATLTPRRAGHYLTTRMLEQAATRAEGDAPCG